MSKFSSFLVFFVLVLGVTDAQENDSNHTTIICGSDNHKHYSYDEKYEATYRKAVVNYFEKGIGVNKSNAVFTIPTVVHIIHDGSPLGTDVNPTDGEIISQIQRASDRFRHQQPGADTYTNPNYGVDTEIDLCLANIDPSGNYSSGILRYYDPINTNDPSYDYMNNLAWDKSLYNNIFIAKDIGGACGYANGQFTVYLASCFNPGLTCHELGHHFSLAHTFSGSCSNNDCLSDGDKVCDTPPKPNSGTVQGATCEAPANSCTTDDDLSNNNPYRPIANGGLGDQPDMYANYMDYTGGCWDAFTLGQKVRMQFNLTNSRAALYGNVTACNGPSMAANDAGVTDIMIIQMDACDKSIEVSAAVNNYGTEVLQSVIVEIVIDGEIRSSQTVSNLNIVSGGPDSLVALTTVILTKGYIGGDYCSTLSACADFNPASANGPGNPTVVSIVGAFPELQSGITSVEICVEVEGDVASTSEVFDVSIEGITSLGVTNNTSRDCQGVSPKKCFMIAVGDYNNMKADGMINISLDPLTGQINPNLCSVHQACGYVSIPLKDACDGINFDPLEAPYDESYSASGYIKALSPVANSTNLSLQAADSVVFKSPFEVSAAGVLEVLMEDCEE